MIAAASPSPTDSSDDERPEFRIAVFGPAAHFRQLLEIVLRHARRNRYRFRLVESHRPGRFEIALVDMTARGADGLAATLARVVDREAVLRVGRRTNPARPCDDLLVQRFVAQVLFALNRVVDLRLRRGLALGAPTSGAAPLVSEPGIARRPRVLVVDPSPTARRQLGAALEQIGIDSEAVSAGHDALERLAQRRYELVLLDVVIPDMNGYHLVRLIKKDRSLRAVPVVILTARSSMLDLARGAVSRSSSYLIKPVALQSLRDTVLRHLRGNSRRRHPEKSGLRFSTKAVTASR